MSAFWRIVSEKHVQESINSGNLQTGMAVSAIAGRDPGGQPRGPGGSAEWPAKDLVAKQGRLLRVWRRRSL